MQTFFLRARMKILPKSPTEFHLNLAGFKKHVFKCKQCFSLWNEFKADTPASHPRDSMVFSLAVSSATLSLWESPLVSHFNPVCISNCHSPWVPWRSVFIVAWSRVKEADESSVLNTSWASVCSFEIFWEVGSWEKSQDFEDFCFFVLCFFARDVLPHAHVDTGPQILCMFCSLFWNVLLYFPFPPSSLY